MRVRFRNPAGAVRTGTWTDDGVAFGGRTYDREAVDVLAPSEPTKLVCVGRNYADHAAEFDNDVPDRPLLFLKAPNAVAGHGDTVTLPAGKQVDYEAELAVVVGEQARNLDEDEAMDAVAGYTAAVDLSNRDDQARESNWVRGKAFDGSAPLGPAVAPPDAVPDDAHVRLRVNGDLQQDSSIDRLAFGVPDLLAEITDLLTLEPGDVVLTGTPEGVGPLEDGDTVAVDVEGVPDLVHDVERAER
jgi:2-keto-4-pentenoate hydratase/2-oxohepta-3-ene-1,7-dioic acid hydratase in catechol pathway